MYAYIAGIGFIFTLLAFVLIYIIIYQHKIKKFNQTLQQKELEKQFEVYDALIAGEEKERKRLAEELHDGIGAQLSGIKMSVEYLKSHLKEEHSNLAEGIFNELNSSINELREISHNLQPSVIGVKGLHNALVDLIDHALLKQQTDIQLFYHITNLNTSEQLELTLFRMCTELLNNVMKHAKASKATLQLLSTGDTIQIVIEDNGVGFKPDTVIQGIGLINIRNRVEHEKGKMIIDSSEISGTTIIIELPIPQK